MGLQWLIDRGMPVQPRGEWQENSDSPCDTGTQIGVIAKEFPEFNFSTVFPEHPTKFGCWAFTKEAVLHSAIDCRRWLKSRPEKVIAVVSHSAFLRLGVTHSQFSNADYRVFEVADHNDIHELVEWKSTEENGGGMGWSRRVNLRSSPQILKQYSLRMNMKYATVRAWERYVQRSQPHNSTGYPLPPECEI